MPTLKILLGVFVMEPFVFKHKHLYLFREGTPDLDEIEATSGLRCVSQCLILQHCDYNYMYNICTLFLIKIVKLMSMYMYIPWYV